MTTSKKIHLILHVLAGGLFFGIAGAMELTHSRSLHGSRWQIIALAIGFLFILIGVFPLPPRIRSFSQKLSISLITFTLFLLSLEAICRLAKFDFVGEERAYKRLPIFYRWPIVPTGEVYFRRSGPEVWTGRPLNEICQQLDIQPNPYGSEQKVTIRYDKTGFRHEEGFTDWDIAIAGDSFTEQGHLAYSDLFTTRLCNLLHTRVLNLGNTNTGPLNQLSFLRDYGLAPSTRRAVIVFFEGNDLLDLKREYGDLMRYKETGQRYYRTFTTDTSLLRTLYHLVSHKPRFNAKERLNVLLAYNRPPSWITGYYQSDHGEVPVTLAANGSPPSRAELTADTMKQLEYFFEQYSAWGNEHHVEIWSVFMPCKERALYGLVRFADNASEEIKRWQPTDLPQVISDLAVAHHVRFMDLSPAFMREAQATHKLLYNTIYDGHLNAEGSHLVATEMARALSDSR